MLKLLKMPKGQIGITLVTSIVFAALWFSYDLPIGIFPALLLPLWIPMFTRREELDCQNASRTLKIVFGVGVLALLVAIGVFVLWR